jgi:hypothetical protein
MIRTWNPNPSRKTVRGAATAYLPATAAARFTTGTVLTLTGWTGWRFSSFSNSAPFPTAEAHLAQRTTWPSHSAGCTAWLLCLHIHAWNWPVGFFTTVILVAMKSSRPILPGAGASE